MAVVKLPTEVEALHRRIDELTLLAEALLREVGVDPSPPAPRPDLRVVDGGHA